MAFIVVAQRTPQHDLDYAGTPAGTVTFEDHIMEVSHGWETCGSCWHRYSCSCGFYTDKQYRGCEIHPTHETEFDPIHQQMYFEFNAEAEKLPYLFFAV